MIENEIEITRYVFYMIKTHNALIQAEEIRALIHLTVENIAIVKDLHSNILSHTNKGKSIFKRNIVRI